MNREPRITDVGADEEPQPRPPWLLPAVIGIGGFALGLLVATTIGSAGPSEPTPTLPPPRATAATTVPPVSPSTTTTSTTVRTIEDHELTLEELVPGFEGTLYFTDPTASTTLDQEILSWSSEVWLPVATGFPRGFPELDSSGSRMAISFGQSLDSEFLGGVIGLFWNLSKTSPPLANTNSFIGSSVSGFVWHATEPGLLAWVQHSDSDLWALMIADVQDPALVETVDVAEFSGITWPVYWDGELIITVTFDPAAFEEPPVETGPATTAMDIDGTVLGSTNDEFLGRLPSGEFVMREGGDVLRTYLSDATFTDRTTPNWLDTGGVRAVGLAPSGSRAFVHTENDQGGSSLTILDEDGPLQECGFPTAIWAAHWSADGAWIVMQANHPSLEDVPEVWFIDSESCAAVRLPTPDGAGLLTAVGR